MGRFDIRDSRFAHYILANASLEELATGFRWIEGLVWMGDADCLLFQDLPRDRTMRWIEKAGQRRRRYYRLTPVGANVLASQRDTWREFVLAISRVTGVEHA